MTERPTVSMATLARVSARQHTYTDARFRELSARLDAIHVAANTLAREEETRRARAKLADRTSFVILAAILAVVLDRATGIPHLAVIALSACPEVVREVYECVRRL